MMMAGLPRPIPAIHRKYPELFPQIFWLDTFGLDSAYDYDPVWAKCQELGFAVTFHGALLLAADGIMSRSVTNGVFNHMGSFAYLAYQLCKSLVFGGVTRRFPDLTFAFLECGVGWASILLANLEEYWEKRNLSMIERRDMARLDRAEFRR